MEISAKTRKKLIWAVVLMSLLLPFFTSLIVEAVNYAETARGVDVFVLQREPLLTVGTPATFDILFTNDGTPLNSMEAELFFDPALISVTNITFTSALCEERFIIDRVIDNVTGRLHMSCGTVTPFGGNVAVFATVTFTPKTPGLGALAFGAATNVYVHDGLGTQIAREKFDATLDIEEVI